MIGKAHAKRLARALGILNRVVEVRVRARELVSPPFFRNLKYRLRGAPDGLPIPTGHLIYLVIGSSDISAFLKSGEAHAQKVILGTLQGSGLRMEDFENVLDFGCGCGRIVRHWARLGVGNLCGTDYNANLVSWCRRNLPFASFEVNGLRPPLSYDSDSFDLVYARSVFTHLSEPLQLEWFRELRRILRPDGLLLFTVSGRAYHQWITPAERALVDAGKLVVREANQAGDNMCAVFHPETWVRETMIENGFTVLDAVPGQAAEFLYQDTYLVRKRSSP